MNTLSKQTQDQIRKEAEDKSDYEFNASVWMRGYVNGAETWAVWKEKAEGYEKALMLIKEHGTTFSSKIATKALEQFK